MEEEKLQALADSLSGHGGRKGLGINRGQYSWVKRAESSSGNSDRTDGLPNNQLYSNFVKAGAYDPDEKEADGDGREIKRDFSDIPVLADDEKKSKKERKKLEKKRLKLEAKKAAKLAEKRALKKALKKKKKDYDTKELGTSTNEYKKRKRDESNCEGAPDTRIGKVKKATDVDPIGTKEDKKKREKKTEKKTKKAEKKIKKAERKKKKK